MIRPSENLKIALVSKINTNQVYTQLCVVYRLDLYVFYLIKKVQLSRYRSRGIALLFHDLGARRGWGVSSTLRTYFTPRNVPVPIVQEAGWAPWSVWTGGKSRPTGIRSPDRRARSQSLYRLSYWAHLFYLILYLKKQMGCLAQKFKIRINFLKSNNLGLWIWMCPFEDP